VKTEPWNINWPAEVEHAIAQLESALEDNARTVWSENPFFGLPVETPHHHVLVALSYMSNLNLRPAIREYEKVLAIAPDLADPHWGIAISLYTLAILTMAARGLCKVSKSEIRFVADRLNEESYLRREAKVLAQGALTFTSVGRAMTEQGWHSDELLGAMALVLGRVSGLIPESKTGIAMSRNSLPTELVPLATFYLDEITNCLLTLADREFLIATNYQQIRVPSNTVNFFAYEMRSVHARVQQLLRSTAPELAQGREYAKRLVTRFDQVRGQSSLGFELFAPYRQSALREANPEACAQAGTMFLAGAFYTIAEEMFQKTLELLPISTVGMWGLAQTYYGLALFDLIERGEFEITWREPDSALLGRIRRAPLKYDLSAMLQLSNVSTLQDIFARKGFSGTEAGRFLALLISGEPPLLPKAVPLPVWRPDERTRHLFLLAFYYAEQARSSSQVSPPTKALAFSPADLESFYAQLARYTGNTTQPSVPSNRHTTPLSEAKKLYHQRHFAEAAEVLDQSLRRGPGTAEAWNWLANCQMELEEYERAVDSFDRAISLDPTEPSNWNDKGVALRRLFRFAEAIDCFQKAHALNPNTAIATQNLDETRGLEQVFREAGKTAVKGFNALSDHERTKFYRALDVYRKALKVQELGQVAQAARKLEATLKDLRDLPGCQKLEWSALERFCEMASKAEGISPGSILAARLRIRELLPVLRSQDETFGSESLERETAIGLGAAFLDTGHWEDAIWILTEVEDNCRRQGAFRDELRSLALKSSALQNIGALAEVERVQARISAICGQIGERLNPRDLLFHELGRAQTLLQTQRFDELRALATEVKPRAESSGLAELSILADLFIASSLFGLGEYEEAYKCFSKIVSDFQDGKSGGPYLQSQLGRLMHHAGKSLLKMGRRDEAVDMHRKALRTERAWWSHEGLSRALETRSRSGQLAEALSSRIRAIEEAERGSKGFSVSEFQLSWFEDKADIYANLASQLLQMRFEDIPYEEHDLRKLGSSVEELAFHFADRGKGRTLLQLVSGLVNAHSEGHSRLLTERRALADEISALVKRRGATHRPGFQHQFEKDTQEIESKLTRQREIESLIRKAGHGALIDAEPVNPVAFRQTLLPHEACIEYAATEDRLLIFLVTTQGIEAHAVDVTRNAPQDAWATGKLETKRLADLYRGNPKGPQALGLEGLIQLQRDWMDNWQMSALSEYEHISVSMVLARVLLPPTVRRSLSAQSITHLLIVPTHWLALTPFSTLVLYTYSDGDQPTFNECRFLLQDYSISFIQSLGVLNAIRQRKRERNEDGACQLLAFGDPIHYDSDPRATEGTAEYRCNITASREPGEAVRLSMLRSLHIISAEPSEEVWPRLEETAPEVLAIARTFKDHVTFEEPLAELPHCTTEAVVCLGHAANRDLALSQALGRFSNILFSVHGHADLVNPWLSFLMLTDRRASPGSRQPAPLTMSDVFDMTLNADTVVLAACETALGRVRPGEGVVGFPLAFLFAGAKSVLLTQWQIPSAYEVSPGAKEAYPSTTIVTNFYHNWRREGMSFAEALREAQLLLYNEHNTFKDPFFWGAWQLYGEWLPQSKLSARTFPGDLQAEARYSDTLQEQGSLSVMKNDFAGGLQSFATALEIREGVLSRHPQALWMVRPWAAMSARVTWLTAGRGPDGSMVEDLALLERLARTEPRQLLDQRRLGCLWFLVGASSYWNGELEAARLFCSAAFSYLDLVDQAFPNVLEVLLEWLAVVERMQVICFEQQEGENGRRFVALWSEIARKTNASLVSAGIKPDGVDEVLSRLDDLIKQTEPNKAVIITTQREALDQLSAVAKDKILVREYAFLCQLEAAAQESKAGNVALKRALDTLQKLYEEDTSDLLSASALMHCLFQAGLRDIRTGHYLRAMNCWLRMKMISVDVKSHGMQLDPGTEKMVDALMFQVPRARRFVCALALMITFGQAGRKRI